MSLQQRKKGRRSKTSAIVSACFHVVLVGLVAFLAARQVIPPVPGEHPDIEALPDQQRKPETQDANPPRLPAKEPEITQTSEPKPSSPNQPTQPTEQQPQRFDVPQVTEPSEMEIPATDAGAVESDPIKRYVRVIQDAYVMVWYYPPGPDDANYSAVIEVGVDSKGGIVNPQFVKGSGDSQWDSTVKTAVLRMKEVGIPPPQGFPSRFVLRFDTVSDTALVQ